MTRNPKAQEKLAFSGEGFVESLNPATGEVMARFTATLPEEVPQAMERAHAAQQEWAARPLRDRCALARRLGEVIYQRRDEIAEVVSTETGKPRVEAIFAEIAVVLELIRMYAKHGPRWLRSEKIPHSNPAMKTKKGWIQYEPWGVVGVIAPWNYPFCIPMGEIVPALIAGNAVVIKPSELTAWVGSLLADLINCAGFPEGLVQVIQGDGNVGAALVEARPDKLFFTGSYATGLMIAQACARLMIPSVLELGGKGAMIILAGANLEQAANGAVWGSLMNCGQACVSPERIYVQESIADEFTRLCVEKVGKLRIGPPTDADAEIGPMIRPRQIERVEAQLEAAVAQGATILAGGKRYPDAGPWFFEPTVITGLDASMKIVREETFGPVVAISRVADAEEAIRLANDSPFALAASVWTGDARQGREIATRLHAGSVMINDVASYYAISAAPHGGRNASGWGRTHSRLGLMEMVHVKYVDVERLPGIPKSWWFGYDGALASAADEFVQALYAPRWGERLRAMRVAAPKFLARMRGK